MIRGGCDAAVREAVDLLRDAASALELHAPPRISVFRSRWKHLFSSMSSALSSNRTATRSSTLLLILETGIPKERLRSVLAYGGFPLSARNVVDGIMNHTEIEERTGRLVPVAPGLETTCPR